MRNAVALLAILALATAYAPVNGDDNTYVSNQSATVKIRASIRYDFLGTSQFTNRLIMPKTNDHDTYSQGSCEAAQILGIPEPVEITIWVDKSEDLATVTVRCDHSIVAVDNPAGGGKVDIYNSLYGSPDVPAGSVIVTIQ